MEISQTCPVKTRSILTIGEVVDSVTQDSGIEFIAALTVGSYVHRNASTGEVSRRKEQRRPLDQRIEENS